MSVPRSLRTMLIVTIITLIVWIMADRSVLRTSSELSLPITVQTDSMYRVTVVEPASATLRVKFTGPGRGIDGLMAQMSTPSRPKWEHFLSTEEAEKAATTQTTHAVPVRDGFARLTGEYRVTLAESSAPQVVVKVQKLLHRKRTVSLPVIYEKLFTNECEFDPKEVTAIGTREDIEDVTAVAQVTTNTPPLTAGGFDEQTVDVKPGVENPRVTFEPAKVTVKQLRLSQALEERTVQGRIPILIEATQDVMKKYYVVIHDRPELTSLVVTAPQGLEVKPEHVRAVLKLLPGEEPNPETPTLRPLVITFSDQDRILDNVRVKGDPVSVSFRLVPRDPAPTPPPG